MSKREPLPAAHPVLTALLIAAAVRIVVAIVIAPSFSGSLVLDDATYHDMAVAKAAGQIEHWDDYTHQLYDRTATMMVPLTLLYRIAGPSETAGRLLVALLGAGVAALVTRLALEVVPARWALGAGLAAALLPSQVLWSSLILKDAPTWLMLTALAVIAAVAARSTGRRLAVVGAGAAGTLLLLGHLRLHTLVVASWALALTAWVGGRDGRLQRGVGAGALALALPWIVGLGPAGLTLVTNAGSLEVTRRTNAVGAETAIVDPITAPATPPPALPAETVAALDRLRSRSEALRQKAADAGRRASRRLERKAVVLDDRAVALEQGALAAAAGEEAPSVEGSLSADIRHLPRGMLLMLFEPAPWTAGEGRALLYAKVESPLWYALLALAALGVPTALRKLRALAFPLLAGAGILVTYALTEGNIGTAFRHRGEFVWVVILLAVVGLQRVVERRTRPTPNSP